mmetsp:Transcript_24441/g.92302  ORF Transcript_24441/g.92302 Transcript_24441/m.92302 type:complete len:232 (+) Transcript_24441:1228-1923(+)
MVGKHCALRRQAPCAAARPSDGSAVARPRPRARQSRPCRDSRRRVGHGTGRAPRVRQSPSHPALRKASLPRPASGPPAPGCGVCVRRELPPAAGALERQRGPGRRGGRRRRGRLPVRPRALPRGRGCARRHACCASARCSAAVALWTRDRLPRAGSALLPAPRLGGRLVPAPGRREGHRAGPRSPVGAPARARRVVLRRRGRRQGPDQRRGRAPGFLRRAGRRHGGPWGLL